jgi:hypothetical protein
MNAQIRRDAAAQIERVRSALREQETQAIEAGSAATAAAASRTTLLVQIRTLQSSLREAQSQVEAGKVQVQQMMVQLQRLVGERSDAGAALDNLKAFSFGGDARSSPMRR